MKSEFYCCIIRLDMVMLREDDRKHLPPYISYRTFQNFLDRLQQGIPARIDRSYWSDKLSGSTGTQLVSALRFLKLVDANGVPAATLKLLVQARGAQRVEALSQIANNTFGFVLAGSLDPESATYAQLEDVFTKTFELSASVRRKCVKFFVAFATDAGVALSPFITRRFRMAGNGTGTKSPAKRKGTKANRNLIVPQNFNKVPLEMSWDKMLLGKFPAFDPSWSDEVKLGWLEAFDGLKFPIFDPAWPDEVKLKWFEAFDKLSGRDTLRIKKG